MALRLESPCPRWTAWSLARCRLYASFSRAAKGSGHLQGVRLFFEIGLVRNAAAQASDDEIVVLAAALEANRLAVGDTESFIRTDGSVPLLPSPA